MTLNRLWLAALVVAITASWAWGQSSSLFLRSQARLARNAAASSRPATNGALRANAGVAVRRHLDPNPALTAVSLFAISPPEPTEIKVNDLVSVVIRHRLRYQSRGKIQQKSEWDVEAKLSAWLRLHDKKLLQQNFGGGTPEVKFESENELRNSGNFDRQDTFETRIQAKIIDIKPNGNLIITARSKVKLDDEDKWVVLTGECNKRDLGPNNTVTDDKIFALDLSVETDGSVTAATNRGWFKKFADKIKPF